MSFSRQEQETIINYNEEDLNAHVYTFNKRLISKLRKLSEERPDECKIENEFHDGKAIAFIVPKKWIKVSAPGKRKPISEERRKELSERMKAMRKMESTQNF